MPRSEYPRNPTKVRGRGTGERAYSPYLTFNTDQKEGERVLKREEGEIGPSPVPRPLFGSALPYARDPKGKDTVPFDRTLVGPNEKPWHDLNPAQVRYRATTVPAVLLSKSERQAAGRDAGLEWDEAKRTYRPRRAATPAPLPATGDSAGAGGG